MVAKLFREGMDAVEAQDLVDARPLKYPESRSDGEEEEEEELESFGGEDFGPDTSLCGMSRPGPPSTPATRRSLSRRNDSRVRVRTRRGLSAMSLGMTTAPFLQVAEGLMGLHRLW